MTAREILSQEVPDSRREEARLRQQFEQACRTENIPTVTVYVGTGHEGWYEMLSSWLFTARKDWRDFWFYHSPHRGITFVAPLEGKGYQELVEWDPEAALIPQCEAGATNMNPAEREKMARSRHNQKGGQPNG